MNIVIVIIILIMVSIIFILVYGPKEFPFYKIYTNWNGLISHQWEKQQWVRLVDIIILGPAAIWLGYRLQSDNKSWGIIPYLLYIYGYGTIVYNFLNYYQNYGMI